MSHEHDTHAPPSARACGHELVPEKCWQCAYDSLMASAKVRIEGLEAELKAARKES